MGWVQDNLLLGKSRPVKSQLIFKLGPNKPNQSLFQPV